MRGPPSSLQGRSEAKNFKPRLVLNVEIVVPTADQYAQTLGAGETFSGLVQSLLEEYSSAVRK